MTVYKRVTELQPFTNHNKIVCYKIYVFTKATAGLCKVHVSLFEYTSYPTSKKSVE